MYHRFRLTNRDDYFWVDFDHFFESSNIFGGICGSIGNWLEPRTEPPLYIYLAQIPEMLYQS